MLRRAIRPEETWPLRRLFTGAGPGPAPPAGGTDPRRGRLRSAPSSRARASPLRLLTLSSAGRALRRGAPSRAGGGEPAVQAARGAPEGTCRRGTCGGEGTPRARPRLARGSRQLPPLRAPCARQGGAPGAPRWARPKQRGGFGKRGVNLAPPGGRPMAPRQPFPLSCP